MTIACKQEERGRDWLTPRRALHSPLQRKELIKTLWLEKDIIQFRSKGFDTEEYFTWKRPHFMLLILGLQAHIDHLLDTL